MSIHKERLECLPHNSWLFCWDHLHPNLRKQPHSLPCWSPEPSIRHGPPRRKTVLLRFCLFSYVTETHFPQPHFLNCLFLGHSLHNENLPWSCFQKLWKPTHRDKLNYPFSFIVTMRPIVSSTGILMWAKCILAIYLVISVTRLDSEQWRALISRRWDTNSMGPMTAVSVQGTVREEETQGISQAQGC